MSRRRGERGTNDTTTQTASRPGASMPTLTTDEESRYQHRITSRLEPTDETLATRQRIYFLAGTFILLSIIMLQPLFFVVGLLIFLLTAIPEVWYRFGTRELLVERRPASSSALFGDIVDIQLVVENRKPLPLPWLQLSEPIPEGLSIVGKSLSPTARLGRIALTQTFALWTYQRVRRRYQVRAAQRGAYRFRSIAVHTSDPFGMLTREASVDVPATLLVQPLVAPLERFGLTAQAPFGEHKSNQRLLEDPLRVAGIRAYALGDEPRRIHWKATARTGTLQSKVYDPATRHAVVLLVDVRTYTKAVLGYDPDLVELSICCAASVATWALEQRYATGLYSNGTVSAIEDDDPTGATGTTSSLAHTPDAAHAPRPASWQSSALQLRLPISSRREQLTNILDGLARVQPYMGTSMSDFIASERHRFPQGATVVYIGAEGAVDVPLVVALRQLRAWGHAVSLLLARADNLTGISEDGTLQLADLAVHYIGGRREWHELVAEALAPASTDPQPVVDDALGSDTSSDSADVATQQNGTRNGDGGTLPIRRDGAHNTRALVVD